MSELANPALKPHGTPDALPWIATTTSLALEPKLEIMATDLFLVGLTGALYAACALFMRLCDRI